MEREIGFENAFIQLTTITLMTYICAMILHSFSNVIMKKG